MRGMLSSRTARWLVTLGLALGFGFDSGSAREQATAAQTAPAPPRAMEPADILDWKTIGPAVLSSDGKWLAYRLSPVQGDSAVIVRATSGDKEYRFDIGEIPP